MNVFAPNVQRFHALHQEGCFVIPNPWDAGSAQFLASLGFAALATTSAGFAWTLGRRDNRITLSEALEHLETLARTVAVPISADFEDGFAVEPSLVATHVAAAATTGIAGLSIEDSDGEPATPLYDLALSIERVRAARQAIDESGTGVLLTARTEGFRFGVAALSETIGRLEAFAEAGADCLYAPGLRAEEDIRAVVAAMAPKPVNVLVGANFTTVQRLADLGVRRISVGGGLARTAWTGFIAAAREIAEQGTFAQLGAALPFTTIEEPLEPSRSSMRVRSALDVVLYAKDLGRMRAFYQQALGLAVTEVAPTHVVLQVGSGRLWLHAIPEAYASAIQIGDPPAPREEAAAKLSFGVASLSAVRALTAQHGGGVAPPERAWELDGAWHVDGWDPEGNVIQFRALSA